MTEPQAAGVAHYKTSAAQPDDPSSTLRIEPARPAADQAGQQQMAVRYNANPKDREFADQRVQDSWLHARPFSVYVGAMGNHWKPRSWAHVVDMVHFANINGYFTVLEEIQDRCWKPYDALGTMRNEIAFRARQGFEYCMYIDNDVLPEPDLLVRLLRRDYAITAPYIVEPKVGRPLHGPPRQKYQGMQPVRWCVLSMLLFKTTVFNAVGGRLWSDALGADEGYHFQVLWDVGHQPYVDTEAVLEVASAPTYPLTVEKSDDPEGFWRKRREEYDQIPDRRPLDPADPRVSEQGIYLPFIPYECKKEVGGCGKQAQGDWWRNDPPVCPDCQRRLHEQEAGLVPKGSAETPTAQPPEPQVGETETG